MIEFADFHCDTLLRIAHRNFNFSARNKEGHLDLPRLQDTNCIFQCFAAFFSPRLGQEAALRQTLRLLHTAKEKVFALPQVTWVRSAEDVKDFEKGNLLGLLSIEGADFVGSDLFLIELVHSLGVRLITLTWSLRNSLGDGVEVGASGGLTDLGRKAVKIMENTGIIVDISHIAEQGFWDLCKIANKPFVASHSNAWTICPHPRNLKDDQIREISRRKGIIGMNFCPSFIAENRPEQDLPKLVQHMVHIAELGSVDILCLGADLDGIRELPLGVDDVQSFNKLPPLMEAAGFSHKDIQAICAGNLLKFLKDNLERSL